MQIIYISKARLPTEKAYGTNMVKTCEALAKTGIEVTLLAPQTGNKSAQRDIFSYYDIKPVFSVHQIPIIDAISMGWWRGGFWLNHLSFLARLLAHNFGDKKETIILARDEIAALILTVKGFRVFYDMHGFPERKRWFWKIIMKRMDGIIATNEWKREQCASLFDIPREKIIIAPNGFDPALFEIRGSRDELRKELGLPRDAIIVMYTGHLYDWKGAGVLLETAKQFQVSCFMFQVYFVFVGGTGKELEDFRKKASGLKNVLVLGHKPPQSIPKYLKAADVLVLPNSGISQNARFAVYSQKDTSPIKLFEYMASGTPVVASDLPSIMEILNERNAEIVQPDSPDDLLNGIMRLLHVKNHAEQIAAQAYADSIKFTWDRRAQNILAFINRRMS
ncbi:MAG: glycosyltransferase family 4 protein [Candidatus Niyogibacteria bacterium]|nr:glycosyltransferase family 4 protein [Candidatus Niyogibacteria bacterium]